MIPAFICLAYSSFSSYFFTSEELETAIISKLALLSFPETFCLSFVVSTFSNLLEGVVLSLNSVEFRFSGVVTTFSIFSLVGTTRSFSELTSTFDSKALSVAAKTCCEG